MVNICSDAAEDAENGAATEHARGHLSAVITAPLTKKQRRGSGAVSKQQPGHATERAACNNCECRLTGGSHAQRRLNQLVEVCRRCYLLELIKTALVETKLSSDEYARVAAQLEEVYHFVNLTGGSHALSQGDHLVEVCRVCYLLGLIQMALVETRLSADDLARVAAQLEEVYHLVNRGRVVDVD